MSRQQGRHRPNAPRSRPMDLSMLNEHGKRIDAQAERLQRDRQNLMQQRTQARTQTFGRSKDKRSHRLNTVNEPAENFNREGGDRYGRRGVPETIPEEPERRYKRTSPAEKVGNLKNLIDRLVEDAKIESQEVKDRLRGIQHKQQQLLNDIEDYSPKFREDRPTGLFEPARGARFTAGVDEGGYEDQKRPYSDYEAVSRATGEGRRQRQARGYRDEQLPQDDVGFTGSDTAGGLGALEGRIADEVLGLRQKNIKLMRALNSQTQNFNDLLADFKRLEQDNFQLKEHLAAIADEVNSVSIDGVRLFNVKRINLDQPAQRREHVAANVDDSQQIRSLNKELDKLHRDNQALKDKLRKATAPSRHSTNENVNQDLKQENAKLKQALRAARADADKLEQELSGRGGRSAYVDQQKLNRLNQAIHDLRDQLGQSQQDVSRLRSENRKLEDRLSRGGDALGQLEELKQENDRLRKETIDLLRVNTGTAAYGGATNKYKIAHREFESPKYGSYQPAMF